MSKEEPNGENANHVATLTGRCEYDEDTYVRMLPMMNCSTPMKKFFLKEKNKGSL